MNLLDLIAEYQKLPEYCGLTLDDVNQVSLFGDRPMNVAATRGSIEEMEVLLKHGALLDAPGEHGYTPLHSAVEQGHLNAVIWLLANGANSDKRNDNLETPADLARLLGEGEIGEVLEGEGRLR